MKCMVCDFPISRRQNNAQVCQACRKFFHRCRLKELGSGDKGSAMRCQSGTNNCIISNQNATAIGSGIMWRMACPKCRYDKCMSLGLEKYFKINVAMACSPLSAPQSICSPEAVTAEQTLRQIVLATFDLSATLISLPLLCHEFKFGDELEAWQLIMSNFDYSATAVSAFLKAMPSYQNLPMRERRWLFAKVIGPIILAETNRLHLRPWSCSLNNTQQLISFFPDLQIMNQRAQKVWSALSNWNPSAAEFACLLAFLISNAANTPGINISNEDVHIAIECCFGSQKAPGRREEMVRVSKLVAEADECRWTTIQELGRNEPHLFATLSPIFDDYIGLCRQLSSSSVKDSIN